jgi:CRP-like cAMP-binding protein
MPSTDHIPTHNRILLSLPSAEFQQLIPHLEEVKLRRNEILQQPGDSIKYIYFPDDAIISMLFGSNRRHSVEVAMEGNESAAGFALSMSGAISSKLSVVREGGTALRLKLTSLKRFDRTCPVLRKLLDHYVHVLLAQTAQTGICNQFHTMDERLARWLLMTEERTDSGGLSATHELIGYMLGVRRSSITHAASGFQRQNLIHYRRGRIDILNRSGLLAVGCPCYGVIRNQYDNFLA